VTSSDQGLSFPEEPENEVAAGAAISKGHLLLSHHFFWAAIFVKTLLYGYSIKKYKTMDTPKTVNIS
jgi:hypothetical protein